MDSAFFMGEKISKGFCKPNKYDDCSGIFKLLIEQSNLQVQIFGLNLSPDLDKINFAIAMKFRAKFVYNSARKLPVRLLC